MDENFAHGAVLAVAVATSSLDSALDELTRLGEAFDEVKLQNARKHVEVARTLLSQILQQVDQANESQAEDG
ncbi:MAG: hypothetical protein WED13_00210 [Methyloceanibacter sp.]